MNWWKKKTWINVNYLFDPFYNPFLFVVHLHFNKWKNTGCNFSETIKYINFFCQNIVTDWYLRMKSLKSNLNLITKTWKHFSTKIFLLKYINAFWGWWLIIKILIRMLYEWRENVVIFLARWNNCVPICFTIE